MPENVNQSSGHIEFSPVGSPGGFAEKEFDPDSHS